MRVFTLACILNRTLKAVTYFIAFPCRHTYSTPLVLNWSPDQVIGRWKVSVDLFSRLFLADGPGAERDSFLAARAGVAGRLARYACACASRDAVYSFIKNWIIG